MKTLGQTLFSSNHFGTCEDTTCAVIVAEFEATGRFFITANHAGFNSKTNNGEGFRTREQALSEFRHFLNRGIAARERAEIEANRLANDLAERLAVDAKLDRIAANRAAIDR